MRNALDGLAEHVRSGRRVDPAAPGGVWDYFGNLSRRHRQVLPCHGLRHLTPARGHDGSRRYRPLSARRIVDVGGNRGTMLAWFLAAVPEAAGVLFDRPESLSAAPGFLAFSGGRGSHPAGPGELPRRGPGR